MSTSDVPRGVHLRSPAYLVGRLDAIAELVDEDRADVLIEAIRDYIEDTADDDVFQELVAHRHYPNPAARSSGSRITDCPCER